MRVIRFTIMVLLLWPACAFAQDGPRAFVSHVGFVFDDGTVLFHRGAGGAVMPGDLFEVVRDGKRVATLEATSVEGLFARAKVLQGQSDLEETDIVREIQEATQGGPFDTTGGEAEVAVIPQGESPRAAEPSPGAPPMESRAAAARETTAEPAEELPFQIAEMPGAASPKDEGTPTEMEPAGEPAGEGTGEPAGEENGISRMVHMDPELEEKIKKRKLEMDLRGYRYLKFRHYMSSGDEVSFLSRNGLLTYGDRIEQGTQLDVSLKYGEDMKLSGQFFELPHQEREMEFEFTKGNYRMLFGDFSADFRTGSLATVGKKITGAEVQYTTDNVTVDYLVSKSKSESKFTSFYGDNSHGPYSLKSFQIVENSEKVTLNGKSVSPDKYTIDYYIGQISFCAPDDITECIEIGSSDLVRIEFEEKLLLSLTGGNLTAVSASYKFGNGAKLGVARVMEEASTFSQRVRESQTLTITGEVIDGGQEDCETASTICLPKAYKGQFALMAKGFERLFKNGVAYDGYQLDDTGYARGEILLTESYTASDTFRVEFSYYVEDYVEEVLLESADGEIFPGNTGQLQYQLSQTRIYAGTEYVRLCTGSLDDCLNYIALVRGVDYTIEEGVNTITFTSAALAPDYDSQQYAEISYVYVQEDTSPSSDYDHTVEQVFGQAQVGPVGVSYEFGRSESDMSDNPAQILREKLLVAPAAIECLGVAAGNCTFSLNHSKVLQLSESITTSTTSAPLQRGTDYNIDYDTGVVTLATGYAIAAGEILFADYQYSPPIQEGLVEGKASRIGLTGEFHGISANLNLAKNDTYFSPIGGNNTLETSRKELSLAGELVKGLSASFAKTEYEEASDVFESSMIEYDLQDVELDYAFKGYNVTYGFGNEDTIDNLPIHNRDETREYSNISIGIPRAFTNDLSLEFSRGEEDVMDNTGESDNRTSTSDTIGIAYKRGNILDLQLKLKSNEESSYGLSDPFTTVNDTKVLKAYYYPTDLITVSAEINRQEMEDSRPDSDPSEKDNSTIQISSGSFGKVRYASMMMTNQSLASFTSGTSNTKTTSYTFQYTLTSALTVKPTLTNTSFSGQNSSSDSNRRSVTLDYRPSEKKYSSSLTYETADTDSSSTTSSSSSTQDRVMMDVQYKFRENMVAIYKFDDNQVSSTGSTSTSTSHSMDLLYQPDEKKKYTLKYVSTSRGGNSSSSEQSMLLKSSVLLSKILSWNTDLKHTKFSGGASSQDYSGFILESELRAEFK